MERVPYMDKSGLNAMEDILVDLVSDDVKVLIVGIQKQPRYLMENIDIIPDLIPRELLFESMEDCIEWASEKLENVVDL